MGAGSSKEAEKPNEYVFTASTPTRFSPGLVGSLEDSPQSDSTRSSNLEWKIQSRVTSELEKISSSESSRVKSITQSISSQPEDSQTKRRFFAYVPLIGEPERKTDLSHKSVSKEIDELKQKMDKRKKLEQLDPAVEKARENLIQCLRTNDRRPLDCWQEREAFKREVGRIEKEFVERTIQ